MKTLNLHEIQHVSGGSVAFKLGMAAAVVTSIALCPMTSAALAMPVHTPSLSAAIWWSTANGAAVQSAAVFNGLLFAWMGNTVDCILEDTARRNR